MVDKMNPAENTHRLLQIPAAHVIYTVGISLSVLDICAIKSTVQFPPKRVVQT